MATTISYLYSKYNESLTGGQPDVVDKYFLMGSPMPLLGILVAYVSYVYYYGPKHMRDKKPYEIENIIILYNAFQLGYNLYMVYLYYVEKHFPTYLLSFGCAQVPEDEKREYFLNAYSGFWVYFFNKVIDLLDTVFFILRKKHNQVTVLHVYHHVATLGITWALLKYYPGHEPSIVGILNSIVHSVMYVYYMIAALGPKYRKYLWWKRYITWMQMTQFVIILLYNATCLYHSCDLNKNVLKAIMLHASINLMMFMNFYYHAYIKPQKYKKEEREINGNTIKNGMKVD